MDELLVLSSKNLINKDDSKNYGDCIILYSRYYNELVVYDCGCEQFAEIVIKMINHYKPTKKYAILSHTDSDHINGFIYLKEKGIKFDEFYTILFDKHAKEICEKIDHKNRTPESVKKALRQTYDSLESLSGQNLRDVYYDQWNIHNMQFVGPSKEFVIEAAAKHINGWESDNLKGTTLYNAISLHVEVELKGNKIMLLLGDALVDAITEDLEEYDIIQLPHHGNKEQAEHIRERIEDNYKTVLFVSDNTGNTNGGSDNLKEVDFTGRKLKNTKIDGDIKLEDLILRKDGTYGK